MLEAKRLAHVTLATPDLERQLAYYEETIGLVAIERSATRAVLATGLGVETLVLEHGERPSLLRIGLQVAPDTDLDGAQRALGGNGIGAQLHSDVTPGVSKALVFPDNCGTTLEVFADYRFASPPRRHVGIMPVKLGHVARFVSDVAGTERFYHEVLGFRTSDWRTTLSVFMRCGPDHHTVNVFHGETHGACAYRLRGEGLLRVAAGLRRARGPGHEARLGTEPAQHRPQHRLLPSQPGRTAHRGLYRDGPDEGRGAGLFRAATLARGHAATAEGLAGRDIEELLGALGRVVTQPPLVRSHEKTKTAAPEARPLP